jgi:hypothetical protein
MKKQILSFLFVLGLGLFMANTAFAQATGSANLGDSKTYTITPSATLGDWTSGGSYAWTINDASAISGTPLTGSSLAKTVVWIKSGNFTITVIGTDKNLCLTEPVTIVVTVSAMQACLTTGSVVNQQICSLLTSELSGNSDGANTVSFPVSVSNSTAGKAYTVDYTFVSGTDTYTGQKTAYVPGEQIVVDILSSATLKSLFTKTSTGNKTVKVTVTGVKQETTNLVIGLCASPTYDITVYGKPAISLN